MIWYQIKWLLFLSFIRQKEIWLIIDSPQLPLFWDLPELLGRVCRLLLLLEEFWRQPWAHLGHPRQPLRAGRQGWGAPGVCSARITLVWSWEEALPSTWNVLGGPPLIQLAAEGMWFALRPLQEASPKVKSSWSSWLCALGHVNVQMGKVEIPNHLHCGFCQTF